MSDFLRELRCPTDKCHTLLLREYVFNGRLEIKCPKCKIVHVFNFKYTKNAAKTTPLAHTR